MNWTKDQLIKLYEDSICVGVLSHNGLCHLFTDDELFTLFTPDAEDLLMLEKEELSTWYWGCGLPKDHWQRSNGFTPLRQTIVLLMAEMAGDKDLISSLSK